jgi:16S rRNA (cytosine1402-N4)-methyltransferase
VSEAKFHTSVLVDQVLHYLIDNPSGIYVDGTIGGGGHSLEILKRLNASGKLIGIDFDDEALSHAKHRLNLYQKQIIFYRGNFADMKQILNSKNAAPVDGILLDLGVSSYQIETGKRGFSFMTEGPLDMRMSVHNKLTAHEIINSYTENELGTIFKDYGEERHSRRIAKAIVKERNRGKITTTEQLVKIIESVLPFQYRIKSLARIFQAVRIEVNQELENLKRFLNQSLDLLKSGGRLVIITYHSLEDRLVKNFFTSQLNPCECPSGLPVCICGKKPVIQLLTRKVITASDQEVRANPRSRSAKLRAAQKIE